MRRQPTEDLRRERCVSRLVVRSSSSEAIGGGVNDDSACSSKTSIKASLLNNTNSRRITRPHEIVKRSNSCKKRKLSVQIHP